MRKTGVLVVAMFLACPTFAANVSREQKRLETCAQVFKEIMDIPDGIPKDLLNAQQGRMRHSDSVRPEVRDWHRRRFRPGCDHLPYWPALYGTLERSCTEGGGPQLFSFTRIVRRHLARGLDASV